MSARVRRASRAAAGRPAESVVAIGAAKGDPQVVRVMVRAPGHSRARCACTLPRERAEALGIRVGIGWSARLSAKVEAISAEHAAREAALHAVATARRPLSPAALARRLRERGHAPRPVTAAIRQLRSDGWISDRIAAP